MPLEVLAIISPLPGKEKRVEEIISSVTESVEATEPYTMSYHSYRTIGDGKNMVEYVVRMKIKDEEALVKRRQLQHHQDVARFIDEENLLTRPMRYMKLESLRGFDR